MRFEENGTSEKSGGTQKFPTSMLSGKNVAYENFGVTEESRQEMIFEKGVRELPTSMLSRENRTYDNFGVYLRRNICDIPNIITATLTSI